jgi:hypothetical protein
MIRYRAAQLVFLMLAYLSLDAREARADSCDWCWDLLEQVCPDSNWYCGQSGTTCSCS